MAKKYSRQKVAHWTAEVVTRLIGTIDTAGFDAAEKSLASIHRFMPEAFFESLPSNYARRLAYKEARVKLEELKELRTEPEKLTPGELRKRERYEDKRIEDFNRRADVPRTTVTKQIKAAPQNYLELTTYSRKQIEEVIAKQDQGEAGGVFVNDRDFTGDTPGANAFIMELFEKIKKKRIRQKEKKKKSGKAPANYVSLFIRYLLPVDRRRGTRPIFIFASEEGLEFDD